MMNEQPLMEGETASTAPATEAASSHIYAIFSALYAPHMGGVESYTAGIAHALTAQGHRVIVVTSRLSSNDSLYDEQADDVAIVRLPCTPMLGGRLPLPVHNATFRALLDEVAAMKPDRVVVNTRFYDLSLDGVAFAARLGLPAIVLEHGSAHLTLGNGLIDRAVQTHEHQATQRLDAYAPMYAGVSQAACAWLEHFGIEAAGVVPNALDAAAYRKEASTRNFRSELHANDNEILVAAIGRMVPEKGIAAILEAAQYAPANVRFALAGDGPLLEAARAAGKNVHALGRLSQEDVAALLRDCDAYLLPSRSEGYSTTLLEACAMGAFPITTDVGGVAELEIGKLGGIVLPDASAISIAAAVNVVADLKEETRSQAAALQEHAAHQCTWEASANALDALFARCAATVEPAEKSSSSQGSSVKMAPGAAAIAAAAAEAEAAGDMESFETDEKLQQLHRVLLMMMKDFSALCERHNLTWIANYGTALGALRHRGFIPWDDDIDICMPRADLEQLADAVAAEPETARKYLIVNARTHAGYPLATTRFVLRGTEFRDSALAGMDFPSGIFLDLFPLDNLADDENAFKRQVYGAWFLNKLAIAKKFENPTIARSGAVGTAMHVAATAARGTLNLPGIRDADPNHAAEKLLTKYAGEKTRRVGYPCDTFPNGCIYLVEDLLPVRWVPFEDMEIPIPAHAEKLLDEYYGDWMTPPPGNARRAHYPDVLDFGPYV